MNCVWHRDRTAVVVWETKRRRQFPLCSDCLNDWKTRAATTPDTARVLGYRNLTVLAVTHRRAA